MRQTYISVGLIANKCSESADLCSERTDLCSERQFACTGKCGFYSNELFFFF